MTSRSRFYVDTPVKRDPTSRHSMFVSQSELDNRHPPLSPTASATLPSSSGSVDRLTELEKKKKHRFSFSNLRSAGSTLSLKPLFSGGSLRRRKSVETRRDSYSQTEEGATVARGVQTQNASTVDVPVQTCFNAWDANRFYLGNTRSSTFRSSGPQKTLPVAKSVIIDAPVSITPQFPALENAAPIGVDVSKPQPLAPSDSVVSLYDEPSSVATTATDFKLIPKLPLTSIATDTCSASPLRFSKKPFKDELYAADSSSPVQGKSAQVVHSRESNSPKPCAIISDSKPSNQDKEAVPECSPSRNKTVQFALSDSHHSPESPAPPKLQRNIEAEFEALLRDLDIITDSAEKINLNQLPSESSRPKISDVTSVKHTFDVLFRQDTLAAIPENNESINGGVENQDPIVDTSTLKDTTKFINTDTNLENRVGNINDDNLPAADSIEFKSNTLACGEHKNSCRGNVADFVKTSEQLVATKLDISVIYPTGGCAYIYEPEIKEETKQPEEKTVIMPTLPSFFEAQPKCGSPDDMRSMNDVKYHDYDAPQEVEVPRRPSTMSLESESEGKNKYSRSNSCNSTRSTTLSGFDTFYESSLKLDSCENLERLEDEIIRSLCTPIQDLDEQMTHTQNDNLNEVEISNAGVRNIGSYGNVDKEASDKRRAILDRLLNGGSFEEAVFSQNVKNNVDGKLAIATPQKFTAMLIKMQDVKEDTPEDVNSYKDLSHKNDPIRTGSPTPSYKSVCSVNLKLDSPKMTSMFVFPEVTPIPIATTSEISAVEVQVNENSPPILGVRRSSWSVPSIDSRRSPVKPITDHSDVEKTPLTVDFPDSQSQCEYTNCLKPSQMQNNPFFAELGSRSLTPRPENNVREVTPSLNIIPSNLSEKKMESTENCDYANCLKPSEVHNSIFTAELSELRSNNQPLRRTPSPLPISIRNQDTQPDVKEYNTIQQNRDIGEETIEPELKIKSELQITLKPQSEKMNDSIKNNNQLSNSNLAKSDFQVISPPPPPPPPPPPSTPQSSLSALRNHQNRNSSSFDDMIKDQHLTPVSRDTKAFTPPKSPMMLELEKKFESRQKSLETRDDDTNSDSNKVSQDAEVNKDDYKLTSVNGTNKVWQNVSPSNNGNKLQNGNNVIQFDQQQHRSSQSPENNSHHSCQNGFNGNTNVHFSPATIITNEPPPPGAVLVDKKITVEGDKIHTDKYYAIPVKEVLKETTSTTKFIPAPPKYEGIGPTEEGIPTGLRHSVKKENMHNWYKTMYKSLHKADENLDDTQEYIIGYTSEPETKKDIMIRKKSATLDNRQKYENKPSNTHVKRDYIPSAKSTIDVYNVHPRLIEDYEPGFSSVTDNCITSGSKRFLPAMNVPKPSYEFKKGYESDTTLTKKSEQPEGLDTEQQKIWYREIQRGGDIPQFGLGKVVPERPKDPVIGPPPPPPLNYQPRQLAYQEVTRPATLPHEYANQNGNAYCQQSNGIYETQMRQAIHSELQRRMSPSSQQLSPPARSLSKSPSKSPDMRTPARALFDFIPESSKELALKKGDMVLVLRQLDKNWYEGEKKGIIGIFPINYVEIVPPEAISFPVKTSVEGLGKALYDFIAQTPLELSTRKGDTLSLIRRVDINWYEGRIGNKKGIIPVSYIQILQQPSESNASSPVPKVLTNSSRSRSGSKERIQTSGMSPVYSAHSPNTHHISDARPKIRSKKGNNLIEPILYRAVYSYNPQNSDEMELMENDTVYVVEMCDDGWFVGTSVRTGEFGIFPGNYVEKV